MQLLRGLANLGLKQSNAMLARNNLINHVVKLNKRNKMNVHSEGKMVVSFLAQEDYDRLLVMSYSDMGFRLTNNLFLMGPIVLFPKQLYSWNVGDASRVTPASTSLFYLLVPKVDLVVFGFGDPGNSIPLETRIFLQNKGINSECLPTKDAVATYNDLVDEGRRVAGAFIPPTKVYLTMDDEMSYKQTGQKRFGELDSSFYNRLAEDEYIYAELSRLRIAMESGEMSKEEIKKRVKELREMARSIETKSNI